MVRILSFISVLCFGLALLCACVSDKDKEDMRSMASSAITSGSSARSSSHSFNYNSSRSDHELDVPDDWKSRPDDEMSSAPDLDINIKIPPFSDIGEGDTGETGGTWEIPEFETSVSLPVTDNTITIPPMP